MRHLHVLLSVVVLVLLAVRPSSASPSRRAADQDDYAYEEDGDEYSSSGEQGEDEEDEEALLRRGRRVQQKQQHLDVADKKLVVSFESQDACPPPPPRRPSQCRAPRCASDADCGGQPRHRCCHNGCVSTCLRTMDPPLVVDWLEETPDAVRRPEPRLPAPEPLLQHSLLAAPKVVALMGGCTPQAGEQRRLQDFSGGGHVRKCFCRDGAILCRVGVH